MSITNLLSAVLKPPDRVLNRIFGKGFGLKDLFTLINLAGGVGGVVLAFLGRPVDASYAVMAGFILGDSLDGAVARLTDRSNRFGSDFDTITDHLAQCIAPAFIVFSFFRGYNLYLAASMSFIIIAAGSIRHARNTAVSFGYHFCWKGLPRPIATMVIFAVLNSQFINYIPHPQWFGALMIVGVSYGLLTDFPFVSHHGRKLQGWVVAIVFWAYGSSILQALFYRRFFWDILLFYMCVYIFLGWIVLHKRERDEFWVAVHQWRKDLEAQG